VPGEARGTVALMKQSERVKKSRHVELLRGHQKGDKSACQMWEGGGSGVEGMKEKRTAPPWRWKSSGPIKMGREKNNKEPRKEKGYLLR